MLVDQRIAKLVGFTWDSRGTSYFVNHFGEVCLLLHPYPTCVGITINHIALVGNSNCGKSSLFNRLTGLRQQVGNFPGVTVDKKTGTAQLGKHRVNFIDLPGTYSLYPKRMDEWVTYRVIMGEDAEIKPAVIVVVADASNLKRNLLFCTQLIDLKLPVVVALTMMDLARQKGIRINPTELERELGVPVVAVDARKRGGVGALQKAIELTINGAYKIPIRDFIDNRSLAAIAIEKIKDEFVGVGDYKAIHFLINHEHFGFAPDIQHKIEEIEKQYQFNPTKTQASEILQRYAKIKQVMQLAVTEPDPLKKVFLMERLDAVLLHRNWGYLILLTVLFLLFQSVFLLAQYPMNLVELGFGMLSGWLSSTLPNTLFSDLIINGIVAGLGGILVFVPQIMILFGLITLLEDSGYMARIGFLSDRLMRSVGLNGKSVMHMISGFACAVPAIMCTRNIENRKERLLTILITPLMSCSARLPVYTTITALVIPKNYLFGVISLQGLVLLGLYMAGVVFAFLVSYIANLFIKIKEKGFFILELPMYRSPRWGNLLPTMLGKAKIFMFDAGKVIMIISLVLWGLSTYGPSARMQAVEKSYQSYIAVPGADSVQLKREFHAAKLQNSYAGLIGKQLEFAISPLGFDWRIGIALVTSFAAREVFVGTMATLFSVGDNRDDALLNEKMKAAVRSNGTPLFTLATGLSLMTFYVFAMQCMSTLAVVKRETKSWKWPMIQLLYMTGLAWVLSWMVYCIFS